MAGVGFSPPTRVFEAAGAGACLITDQWTGIETFFKPGREILVATGAEQVVSYLRSISAAEATHIGANMRERALQDHTYQLRARQFNEIVASGLDAIANKNIASKNKNNLATNEHEYTRI
jgi:spore maturation protein CgeB